MFLLRSSWRQISSGQLSSEEAKCLPSQEEQTELSMDESPKKTPFFGITAQFIASRNELSTTNTIK